MLLASVFTVGMAGALASGAIVTDPKIAFADPVRVEAPAPADFTAVVESVKPAVVSVQVKSKVRPVADGERRRGFDFRDLPDDHPFNDFFRRYGERRGFEGPRRPRREMSQGSGFFISEDGYLVTNNHVVDGGDELVVVMDDGRELDAKLIGRDRRTDLALLKVEGNGFTYVAFAKDKPKIGQWVVAVGNPFGLGGTVTAGIISADGRDIGSGPYDDFIQIDAPVNRGNSGGPTFNTRGEVIGVNTAIFSPSGGNVGIAFAIPAATVQDVISEIKQDGSVTRGWLGVRIQPVTKDIAESLDIASTKGALVSEPQQDGPAIGAGILAGDIITKVGDKAVAGPRELARVIAGYDPGETVAITVLRDGKEKVIDVELGKLANQASIEDDNNAPVEPTSLEALGLELAPSEDGEGVVVTGVDENGPAAEKGIRTGDLIRSVGGERVEDVNGVNRRIEAAQKDNRKNVLFQIERDNGSRFVALPLQSG
ncbi:MAG TPA: Do family serine endopeptidase [Afifellaceae bacterium]|nr:Do family serine endopeptidase [Afifellaceae bacterium]